MSREQLHDAFLLALDLPSDTDVESLAYNEHDHWDSVGHMVLIAELESRFNVALDTDDVVEMSSYAIAVEILRRYGVAV